jgi:hypothetical protein
LFLQGSELPAFNAAEIARDIRVNLKLREKQRLTGATPAPPSFPSICSLHRSFIFYFPLPAESLNRVTAEVSATRESLVLSREKASPLLPPNVVFHACAKDPWQYFSRPFASRGSHALHQANAKIAQLNKITSSFAPAIQASHA